MNRRKFINNAGLLTAGIGALQMTAGLSGCKFRPGRKQIEIVATASAFEKEPLIRPFGFKGGYMNEIWQTVAMLQSRTGVKKVGICSQNVLWSDENVFASNTEEKSNELMFSLTKYALNLLKGHKFVTPIDLLDSIFEEVYEYGCKLTGRQNLRKTFVLNSFVGIDNAAWLLYAGENGISSFDDMIPDQFKKGLSVHHNKVASIPLISYTIPAEEIKAAVDQGYFFLKIKIGHPGTQEEMLEKDRERLLQIHKTIGNAWTPYTTNGKLPYYFDANGRYEKKETLLRFLDYAKMIGAFDQIAIVEEPFPEDYDIDVSDISVRIAADESAHTVIDALERIKMGYGAIALKAIAKTLSMTLKIINVAYENNIPCFCADLTVNPILVEWNKNVAARLKPFPGIGLGLLETNGHQNYKNWAIMKSYHPFPDALWANARNGIFELDNDFYSKSGGIFIQSPHYINMVDLI
ncbi:MAG TPA: enolase C-terminal domain-like protein [Bacteroidales bacterium]|nr:enolase C-terminal domain-like protein [Bacteroidales bacterium]